MYNFGIGVEQDFNTAYYYYQKAVDLGSTDRLVQRGRRRASVRHTLHLRHAGDLTWRVRPSRGVAAAVTHRAPGRVRALRSPLDTASVGPYIQLFS